MASLKAFEELSETCLSPTVPCGITNKQRVRKRLSPSNMPKIDVWKAAESCLPLPCRIAMERPVPRGKLNFNFWKKRRKLRWLSIRNSCWIYLLQEEEALVKYSCLPDLALEEKDVISTLPGTPSGFLKYQWPVVKDINTSWETVAKTGRDEALQTAEMEKWLWKQILLRQADKLSFRNLSRTQDRDYAYQIPRQVSFTSSISSCILQKCQSYNFLPIISKVNGWSRDYAGTAWLTQTLSYSSYSSHCVNDH